MLWAYKRLLDKIIAGALHKGRLTVLWPDGTSNSYGNGEGQAATIRLRDARTVRRIFTNPALTVGETYMDEGLIPVNCTIHDLLSMLMLNIGGAWDEIPVLRLNNQLRRLKAPFTRANTARRSRRNVAHHYDLNGRLYALFLDRDRQYSCAYFPHGNETLEEAQLAKKRTSPPS